MFTPDRGRGGNIEKSVGGSANITWYPLITCEYYEGSPMLLIGDKPVSSPNSNDVLQNPEPTYGVIIKQHFLPFPRLAV